MARLQLLLLCSWFVACTNGALQTSSDCASATDVNSCQALSGCKPLTCPDCRGQSSFECVSATQQVACGLLCVISCADIKDATTCDTRSDCHALYSGDLPCNNSSCINHFVKCDTMPTVCRVAGTVCNGSCVQLTPNCPSGFAPVFNSTGPTCCATGCVAASKCPAPTSCSSDGECGAGNYCNGLLSVCKGDCQYTIGVAAVGTCHRSCDSGSCQCTTNADCPGAFTSCDVPSGVCKTIAPPICHAPACPSGCTESTNAQSGPICVCNSCPP